MCTLTWWREGHRYALFFNRDELKTRLPALPPAIRERHGVRFIAPADGDHGGTWLLVNEFGLSVALLNFYDAAESGGGKSLPGKAVSRGELVLSLGHAPTPGAVAEALAEKSLVNYRPFHLFAIAPREPPRLWTWGGAEVRTDDRPEPPITTSSYRTAEVCARRKARYREAIEAGAGTGGDPLPDRLDRYHHGIDPDDGAFSVRMRRPDAQTVSFNRIDVDADAVRFTYRPEPVESLEINEAATLTLPFANAP